MSQAQAARPTRVLILDEDRVEGGMLAFHLRREGLVVMLMTSAEEAADAIAWAEPDVLLVEVAAQGFDGREFLSQLAHLPVDVFAVADRQLTGEVELDALRLGVIDVMMKPIDPVTLARRLKTRPERKRRGSIAGLPEGGISGDLAVHSVVHLLQMAHRHRLNARLHIEVDGDWAVLLVRHGEVIDAEAPHATGREAAFQMVRTQQGAFVLFPLPSEAEELSRDDVIRADLATLVADAIGRREPRAVNVVKTREQDTFVLPHIGSPRAPLTKRGGEDTLEYAAETNAVRGSNPDSARVRRPGEREREMGDAAPAIAKPMRQPTMPISSATATFGLSPSASELALRMMESRTLTQGSEPTALSAGRAPEIGAAARAAIEGPFGGRNPIESPTVDEGFEEHTDQEELRRPRSGHAKRPITGGSGLRRVATGSAAMVPRNAGRQTTDPELDGIEDEREPVEERRFEDAPRRRRAAKPSWSLPTLIMAGAAVVLALVIVVRLATRETPAPIDIDADPTLKLGQALIDMDEGRNELARTSLSTLAIDRAAPSEVLASLARLHYREGRLVEAQALLERLVDRNPGDAETLAWLGLVQAERKEMPRARVTFEKALKNASGPLAERLRPLVPRELPPVPPTEGAVPAPEVRPAGGTTPAHGATPDPAPGQ